MHGQRGIAADRLASILLLVLGVACTPTSSEEPGVGESAPADREELFELVEVAQDVYATVVRKGISPSAYANSLIVLRDDHALVVDSRHTPGEAERLIEQVRRLTRLPVRYLVNTHFHGDHVHGNQAFREHYPDVRVIGHRSVPEDMRDVGRSRLDDQIARITSAVEARRSWLETGEKPDGTLLTEEEKRELPGQLDRASDRVVELARIEVVVPDVAVDQELRLDDAQPEVRIFSVGPAHTRGDLVVWVPSRSLLAVGDLLEDGMMYFGDGYPAGWARALGRLSSVDASILVPAHGPLLRDRELFDTERRFVEGLVERARAAADEGTTLERALERVDFSAYEAVFTRGDTTRSEAFAEWVSESFERAFREATGDLAASDSALAILRGSRRALGGVDAVRAVSTLRAEADVVGPSRDFVTVVWSGRDGRARMEQSQGFVGGAHPSGDWRIDGETGAGTSLDPDGLAYLRGHELHATVLFPESRYRDARPGGSEDFAGQPANVIRFTDDRGEPALGYYSARDTLPVGFRITHTEPDVVVTLADWEARGEVRVFTRATFRQGDETYEYSYVNVELDAVPDSVFVVRRRLAQRDTPQ